MSKQDYSFIGYGRFFAKELISGDQFELGNLSSAVFSAEENERALKNFKTGQGNANSSKSVDSVALALTLHDIDQDNLAMLLYGDPADVVSGSVTDESITAKVGGLSRTAQINISNVVVTDDPMTVTYVEGDDYEVTSAGIVALAGGAISDDDALLIDYDYTAAKVVEALTQSAKEYELTFVGLNDAQSGKAVVVDTHRVKPSIFQELALISEDYAAPQINVEVLPDQSKTGAGISQYFKYSYVE